MNLCLKVVRLLLQPPANEIRAHPREATVPGFTPLLHELMRLAFGHWATSAKFLYASVEQSIFLRLMQPQQSMSARYR